MANISEQLDQYLSHYRDRIKKLLLLKGSAILAATVLLISILGATLVAAHAGDMLGPLCLAITHGIGLGKFAGTIFPYPTQGEVLKKAAHAWRSAVLVFIPCPRTRLDQIKQHNPCLDNYPGK